MFEWLVKVQSIIRAELSAYVSDYATTGDVTVLLALLPAGIVFGVVHALTPGHSKAVMASYAAGSDLRAGRAMLSAFLLSLTHVTSAVVLAVTASALVTRTIVGAGQAPALELLSRGLLVALALWLIARPFLHRSHLPGEGAGFGIAAGLIPCPLTLFVMTMAMAKAAPLAGFAFAIAMLIGVAIVLASVALLSILARNALVLMLKERQHQFRFALGGFDILTGCVLLAVCLRELLV